ncbi:hypothetical protein [Variovorax sp. YR216]|uniref:hypothetical protein n=1 Tax=Variovorax sp. YR216 TaxID=1882828 RepID=UPI00089C7311|nr:hypothetical protein [Variovorax sp. YR216]SEA71569.1 hypothetical protein SAMN05444680_103240 [Variovorax sp. YR216]
MNRPTALRSLLHPGRLRSLTLLALGFGALCPAAFSQFALAVSPPRFELKGKPGTPVRDVIELSQIDARPGAYTVRTADWTFKPDATVDFIDALAPDSCRPWVAIERKELTVTPGRPYRFRFEVTPPPDTPPTECRFAILVEGKEQAASPNMPIGLSARVGVVVYVAVGDVKPSLSVVGATVQTVNGVKMPVLKVRNDGTAHGRLAGFLKGTDASGTALEFTAATLPILPGETRDIALSAARPGNADAAVQVSFPVTVRGKLEWGESGSTEIDQRFAP